MKKHFPIFCSMGRAFCPKVSKEDQNNIFERIKMGIKNAEFYAEYKTVKRAKIIAGKDLYKKLK